MKLEFDGLVERAALLAARTVHVRIVGINIPALFTTKNVVGAGRRTETLLTLLVIYGDGGECRKKNHHVSHDYGFDGHRAIKAKSIPG